MVSILVLLDVALKGKSAYLLHLLLLVSILVLLDVALKEIGDGEPPYTRL